MRSILLILCLFFAGLQVQAFKPMSGYINHEKLLGFEYTFNVVIYFADTAAPDSIFINFGDNRISKLALSGKETHCRGFLKCEYQARHTYVGTGQYVVTVTVDPNTYFIGKNAIGNSVFFIEEVITIAPGGFNSPYDVFEVTDNSFNPLITHTGNTAFIAYSENMGNYRFEIIDKYLTTPEGLKFNAATGELNFKRKADPGLYNLSIIVTELKANIKTVNRHNLILALTPDTGREVFTPGNGMLTDTNGFYFLYNNSDTLRAEMNFTHHDQNPYTFSLQCADLDSFRYSSSVTPLNDTLIRIQYTLVPKHKLDTSRYYTFGIAALNGIAQNCNQVMGSFSIRPGNQAQGVTAVGYDTKSLRVFPNPGNRFFTLEIENTLNTQCIITDNLGRSMPYTQEGKILDLGQLPAGIYFLNVIDQGQTFVQRIVKQ